MTRIIKKYLEEKKDIRKWQKNRHNFSTQISFYGKKILPLYG